MTEVMGGPPTAILERVWSLPVRIAHWTLAALIAVELFNDSGGKPHRWIGYAAAAIVVARLAYGLRRTAGAARLALPSPGRCAVHLREMLRGRASREAGHNPLGAWMAMTIWALVVLLGLTGWVSRWDRYWGEDWPIDLHALLSDVLQVCVVLHLLGVAVSSVLERQNLARAMWSGRKYIAPDR